MLKKDNRAREWNQNQLFFINMLYHEKLQHPRARSIHDTAIPTSHRLEVAAFATGTIC